MVSDSWGHRNRVKADGLASLIVRIRILPRSFPCFPIERLVGSTNAWANFLPIFGFVGFEVRGLVLVFSCVR